jgi:GH35 family endo-1,4-beta-xylanase
VRARLLVLAGAALAGGGGPAIDIPSGAQPPPPGTYSRPLGMAVQEPAAQKDAGYVRDFVTTATSLTPENELKWAIVHPEPNRYDFGPADDLVDLARRSGKRVRGHTRLFINELAAERPGPKRDAVLGLAADLRARGAPLDGIGLQDHTTLDGAPSQADLEDTMNRIAGLGLDVELSEVDVAIPPPTATAPAVLDAQAQVFGATAAACAAVARCTGMTVWGVDDRWSWLGAARRPLLFDADARPKPALAAVRAALGASGHG